MKTVIVPAQITTVEDKIAGNLNLTQMLLLLTPVFSGSAIYIVLPPSLEYALYKLICILVIAAVSCGCAIRFKEKMIVQWIGILLRYGNRPRYYLYNKNDLANRKEAESMYKKAVQLQPQKHTVKETVRQLSFTERIKKDLPGHNQKANVSFKPARKGGMYVYVSEIK
ncbi:MAG: PrgI family protein [Candidatus Margulisiibacteriota bacterium]